jgi:hypothetical protein
MIVPADKLTLPSPIHAAMEMPLIFVSGGVNQVPFPVPEVEGE